MSPLRYDRYDLPDRLCIYRVGENESLRWLLDLEQVIAEAARYEDNVRIYSGTVRKSDIAAHGSAYRSAEITVREGAVDDEAVAFEMNNRAELSAGQYAVFARWRDELRSLFGKCSYDLGSEIHGAAHMLRVLAYAILIASTYPEIWNSEEAMRLLCTACITHDIGRVHDGVDDRHGARSWRKLQQGKFFPLSDELEFLVTYHCLRDSMAQDTPFALDAVTWRLYQILKDADALDRVRFGLWDLNVSMLRCPAAPTFISYALKLQRRDMMDL